MKLCAIDCNDSALTACVGQRRIESPGFAVVDNGQVIVGAPAYRQARLNPRGANNRFWDQLSLEPLPRAVGSARSYADLAFAHLGHLWAQLREHSDSVVLAVPGTFDRNQLGLLLGIAQECSIPVVGMVDSAIAAAAPAGADDDVVVADLLLHRALLTWLDVTRDVSRRSVDDVAQSGLGALYDSWANAISDAFVHTTRFDPLHVAETEQALYDQLPVWLGRLREEPRAVIELEARHKTHSVTVDRRQLLSAADRVYGQLAHALQAGRREGATLTIQLTSRCAALPGLIEHLSALPETRLVELAPDAVARGVERHLDAIRSVEGQSVGFVTRLPYAERDAAVASAPARELPAERPTHLLMSGRAYPLDEAGLLIGSDVPAPPAGLRLKRPDLRAQHCRLRVENGHLLIEDLSDGHTYLNGTPVGAHSIGRVGDALTLGEDLRLDLITVVGPHGA